MLNRWQRTIVDLKGNVVPYAVVTVRRESDQGVATVYRDRAGAETYPNGQVTANQNGYLFFYARADLYRITATVPDIDWRDVDIGAAAAQKIAQQALDNALPTYETLVELQSDVNQPTGTMARVINDPDPDDNGYYLWDGSDWDRTSLQPADLTDIEAVQQALDAHKSSGDHDTRYTRRDQNLADLDDAATARDNLGLGSAATESADAFATATQGQTADSAVQPGRKVTGTGALEGGGDLSEDRTIDLTQEAKDSLDKADSALQAEDTSEVPAAGKIPVAGPEGVIVPGWVKDLDYKLDQLLAQQWANKWPGIPAPSFYQEFGGGASLLDPRITFTRASDSWYFKDGVLVKADVNEPVFENGALRLEPSATNLFGYSSNFESANIKDNCTIEFIDDDPLFPNGYSKVTDDSTSGHHGFRDSRGRSTTDNPVLIRYLVKPWGGLRYIAFSQSLPTSPSNTAILDTDTGAVTSSISSGIYGAIYRGSGWWEVYFQYSRLLSAGGSGYASLYCSAGPIYSDTIYSGTGTQGFLVAAAQATELLSIDNSFIFTNGANVTRAADNLAITGRNFTDIFNPYQGCLHVPAKTFYAGGDSNILCLSDQWGVRRDQDGFLYLWRAGESDTKITNTDQDFNNLKLRWGSNGLDVFVGENKELHDLALPAGAVSSLVLADSDSAMQRINSLRIHRAALTDNQMEALQ